MRKKHTGVSLHELDRIYAEFVKRNPKYAHNDDENKFIPAEFYGDFLSKVAEYLLSPNSTKALITITPFVFDFIVIDYKYISEHSCSAVSLSDTRKLDVQKQLVYEFALQLNYQHSKAHSEFWIPHFFEEVDGDFEEVHNLNRLFSESRIKVVKRNFLKLQQLYISND